MKQVPISQIRIDEDASVAGRWAHVEFEVADGVTFGMCVKVARWGNPRHQKTLGLDEVEIRKLRSQRKGKIRLSRDPDELARDLGSTILLDFGVAQAMQWPDDHPYRCPGKDEDEDGRCCAQLVDDDGKTFEPTEANRIYLMRHVPDLATEVTLFAKDQRNYREQAIEEIQGNSSTPSAGPKRTAHDSTRSAPTKRRASA